MGPECQGAKAKCFVMSTESNTSFFKLNGGEYVCVLFFKCDFRLNNCNKTK